MMDNDLGSPIQVFLIEPFDEAKEKRRSVVNEALKESLGANSFVMSFADQERQSEWLHHEVFRKIDNSNLVIADTFPEAETGDKFGRPNVYLELGYALGEVPIILIEQKEDREHSDLQGFQAIRIDPDLHWEERMDEIGPELVDSVGDLYGRIVSSAIEDDLRSAQKGLDIHINKILDDENISLEDEWNGLITEGASGFRVIIKEEQIIPPELILEVRSEPESIDGDLTQDEFLGLAKDWERNSHGHSQGQFLCADGDLLLQQNFEDGDHVHYLRCRLIVWNGVLHD